MGEAFLNKPSAIHTQFVARILTLLTLYSQNPLASAFLCYMAGIPLRLAHCHESPYQLLAHWVKDPEPEHFTRHEVRRQLSKRHVCIAMNQFVSLKSFIVISPQAEAVEGVARVFLKLLFFSASDNGENHCLRRFPQYLSPYRSVAT
jgi:hypothetical protein